jgi:hypothetical protein
MRSNNVTFLNSSSEPFLAEHIHNVITMKNNVGVENVKIDDIPVRSVTDITTFVNASKVKKSNDEDIIIYVRSDDTIGHRGTFCLISFYVIVALFYMLAAGVLVAGIILREPRNAYIITAIFVFLVLS